MSPEWGGEENEIRCVGGPRPEHKDGVGYVLPEPYISKKKKKMSSLLHQNKSTHKQRTFEASP